MTVAELRKALEAFPDDTLVSVFDDQLNLSVGIAIELTRVDLLEPHATCYMLSHVDDPGTECLLITGSNS